jgi:hypothetical protein
MKVEKKKRGKMTDEITAILQKTVDDLGLSFPVAAVEKLCKFCLENSPSGSFFTTNLEDSLRYKMHTFVGEICSTEGGIYAVFQLLGLLDNPRWGYYIGEACYMIKVKAGDLIACLQRGIPQKALPGVLLFCTEVKGDMGAQFTSAFIDALTGPKEWNMLGLSTALMLLNTSDKAALPALAGYKQKMDAAIKHNSGTARESFVALRRQIKAAMVKIEGSRKKWWQFWK